MVSGAESADSLDGGTGAARDVLGSAQFGAQAQQLRPLATLQEGLVKLGS